MDTSTGELTRFLNDDDWKKAQEKAFGALVEVDEKDMTQKQKETMQVSSADTRSRLGIQRRKMIKQIGRNNPCPCGSGLKYKKCCLV